MTARRKLMVVVFASAIAAACGTSGRPAAGVTVEPVLTAQPPAFVSRDPEGTRLWTLTKQFYQKRGNTTAWIEGRKPRPQMGELLGALQKADRDGLDPALYNAPALTAKQQEAKSGLLVKRGFDESEAAGLDVLLTYLYLQYASDRTNGLSNLSHADPQWKIKGKRIDVLSTLEQALDQNQVGASLDALTPSHQQYAALRDALQQYREIAKQGGWPQLPATLKLKPGQHDAAVPLLAKRLSITGDFAGTLGGNDTTYGTELQEAVKRFQRRHGLTDDGVVAPATIAQMNVPVEQRIEQIALNLERWRWLPRDLGERYVLVNIPEYRLEVWDHGKVPVTMRVVVGKKDTPTPIFSDDMTHVVFAPYWNVPAGIATNETIPSAIRDPAFLQRTNMEVLDRAGNVVDPGSVDLSRPEEYRFRQRPGGGNSLGYVKFMFPNQFNVYLHDTPADSLFARAARSFSHGCVRVEQPEALAAYVLADQPDWTAERIQEAMHGGQERSVKLKAALPVYLGYWTARTSADGILQFRDDLYGIDARQTRLLEATLSRLKAGAAAGAGSIGAPEVEARRR